MSRGNNAPWAPLSWWICALYKSTYYYYYYLLKGSYVIVDVGKTASMSMLTLFEPRLYTLKWNSLWKSSENAVRLIVFILMWNSGNNPIPYLSSNVFWTFIFPIPSPLVTDLLSPPTITSFRSWTRTNNATSRKRSSCTGPTASSSAPWLSLRTRRAADSATPTVRGKSPKNWRCNTGLYNLAEGFSHKHSSVQRQQLAMLFYYNLFVFC